MTDMPFSGRIALVTGASRGIGYQIALQLGQKGAHVIALARTVGGLEELDDEIKAAGGQPATLVPVDLKDYDAIDRLGAAIYERFGKLDILVGNAGVLGAISPLGHVEPKTWDEVMAVNVTANWRLIRSLDPLLRRSDAGRALFVSSGAAKSRRAYWGPYSVSKAALEAMVETYARETETTAVKANLLDPGKTRTAMRARAMPGEDPDTLPRPAEVAADALTLLTPDVSRSGHVFVWRDGGFVE
jgi:NAD(P)-dependent dehydrogenase (short-subunit alcohol dehydrogenase family)